MTTASHPQASPTVTVGVDTVTVDDVRASIAGFGPRYLDRVFTAGEQAACTGTPVVQARGLAARFAAKEATLKALRCADLAGPWTDIELFRHPGGWAEVRLRGQAAVAAAERDVHDLSVSFTHDHDRATAVVVAVSAPTRTLKPGGLPCPTS